VLGNSSIPTRSIAPASTWWQLGSCWFHWNGNAIVMICWRRNGLYPLELNPEISPDLILRWRMKARWDSSKIQYSLVFIIHGPLSTRVCRLSSVVSSFCFLLVRIPLSFCCFYVGAREPVFLNINVYSEFSLSDQEVGCMMNPCWYFASTKEWTRMDRIIIQYSIYIIRTSSAWNSYAQAWHRNLESKRTRMIIQDHKCCSKEEDQGIILYNTIIF
jgi:hypothetical protein